MPKWLRRVISGLIAVLIFAGTYPNVISDGRILFGEFIYILCLSIIPFLVVAISVGRSVIWERIGWGAQIVLLVAAIVR